MGDAGHQIGMGWGGVDGSAESDSVDAEGGGKPPPVW